MNVQRIDIMDADGQPIITRQYQDGSCGERVATLEAALADFIATVEGHFVDTHVTGVEVVKAIHKAKQVLK